MMKKTLALTRNRTAVVGGHLLSNTAPGRTYPAEPTRIAHFWNHYITDDAGKRLLISNRLKREYFSEE